MANDTSNATCPEIANENDSKIELSTYNTSVNTSVVIGCKGFGRHVSDPTNVVCLDTGAWSETPNLKCKINFDEKERLILGASIASAILVLLVLICICLYCCCCRRRRRRHWHRDRDWWGWRDSRKDDLENGWTGWGSHKEPTGYSGGDKEKKGGWWTGWTSRKEDYHDSPGADREKGGFGSGWTSRKDQLDYSGDRNEKNRGMWSGWASRKEIGDYPGPDRDKGGMWSGWASRKEIGDYPGPDREKGGIWSGWASRKEVGDYPGQDGKKSGMWSGWTSRKEVGNYPGQGDEKDGMWSRWSSRKDQLDYPGDQNVRGGWWSKWPGWNNRIFGESGQEIVRSRANEYAQHSRVRRYSDPSLLAQRRLYGGHDLTYESSPNAVDYHRVRRYSDPMINRSNYVSPRQEIIYDSKPVSFQDSYKPSYTVVKTNEAPRQIIEREPATFEYNRPAFHYASPEVMRYIDTTHVLDPVYYSEPRYYRDTPRYHSSHSGDRLRHTYGHRRMHGQLLLAPLALDKISNYVNFDLNQRNVNRVTPSARIVELDNADTLGHGRLADGDLGRSSGAHYEVNTINPSTSYFLGRQDYPYESRPEVYDKVRDYVLYHGKGKSTEVLDNATEFGEKSRIIY